MKKIVFHSNLHRRQHQAEIWAENNGHQVRSLTNKLEIVYMHYLGLFQTRADNSTVACRTPIEHTSACNHCRMQFHTVVLSDCGCQLCDYCLLISQWGFILSRIEGYINGIYALNYSILDEPQEDCANPVGGILCVCPVHSPNCKASYILTSFTDVSLGDKFPEGTRNVHYPYAEGVSTLMQLLLSVRDSYMNEQKE